MAQTTTTSESFTIKADSNMFAVGFAVGLILGKLILRNTMLSVAFATGLGLAVSTTAEPLENRTTAHTNGRRATPKEA